MTALTLFAGDGQDYSCVKSVRRLPEELHLTLFPQLKGEDNKYDYENITTINWLCSGLHGPCFDGSVGTGASIEYSGGGQI